MIRYEKRRLWWLHRCTCHWDVRGRTYRRDCKRHGHTRMVDGWKPDA